MQWSGPDKTLLEQAHRYAELGNRARRNVKNGVAYLSLPDSPVESRRQLPTTRWTPSKGGGLMTDDAGTARGKQALTTDSIMGAPTFRLQNSATNAANANSHCEKTCLLIFSVILPD